ncbi:MAG: dihydropteroate synthase [Puniceicoccaceae bacterium MED-G31]|nr:MAG: dihydropteroate synthase [Puniceicoccaceae bacterium MED-G31]|tara:strand:+ start:629 stop:1465 length:837 start_codon:yes stop_codon:yes gene_type:complete
MSDLRTFFTNRRSLFLGRNSHIVGILNLTPDSFSDGGDYVDIKAASLHAHQMVQSGASIIDIGGESTRPGYDPVTVEEEIHRVVPFIKKIRPYTQALLSIDTSKSDVADAALKAGADIVNDVWGAQRDPNMAAVIASHGAACILMHNRPPEQAGCGKVMQSVRSFLMTSTKLVRQAGVRQDSIALDPGLGFGKTYEENWEIMRQLSDLKDLGYPILIGASRKSMLAKLLDRESPKSRLSGTLATTALAIQSGVDFIRVHDVLENADCAAVINHCLRYE